MDENEKHFRVKENTQFPDHIEGLPLDPTIRKALILIGRKLMEVMTVDGNMNSDVIFVGQTLPAPGIVFQKGKMTEPREDIGQLFGTMTQIERTRLENLLATGSESAIAAIMGTWMKGIGPFPLELPTDPKLTWIPMDDKEREAIKNTLQRTVAGLIAQGKNKPLETLGKYLRSSALPPKASGEHVIGDVPGGSLLDVTGLVQDLEKDPRYTDFLEELPPLLRNAAERIFDVAHTEHVPTAIGDLETEEAIKSRVGHVVRTATFLRGHIHVYVTRHLKQQTERDRLIADMLTDSVMEAWYLDAFRKSFPNTLSHAKGDSLQRQRLIFTTALSEIRTIKEMFQGGPSDQSASIKAYCRKSGEQCARFHNLTNQLFALLQIPDISEEVSAEEGHNEPVPRTAYMPWLHAASLVKNDETLQLTTSEDGGGFSYGRMTVVTITALDPIQRHRFFIHASVCQHRPHDPPVFDGKHFIPLKQIYGSEHHITTQAAFLADQNESLRTEASDIAIQVPWIDPAKENKIPLRYVTETLYREGELQNGISFLLLTGDEATMLSLTDDVTPLPPEAYAELQAVLYPFPEKDGAVLGHEDLFCYILDEGDDEETPDDALDAPTGGVPWHDESRVGAGVITR